jgi:hypothetical protein
MTRIDRARVYRRVYLKGKGPGMDTMTAQQCTDGEQFVAWDDEERWIGAAWPSGDYVAKLRRYLEYAAVDLADAIADDDEFVGYSLDYYKQKRAEHQRIDGVYRRLTDHGQPWIFPGALVNQW